MDRGRPTAAGRQAGRGQSHRSTSGSQGFLSTSLSSSPLAEQYLAQDIAACSDDDYDEAVAEEHGDAEHPAHGHGHGMYRRPSGVAYGGARPVFNAPIMDEPVLSALERKQSRDAERSLLRDNHVLPPKHPAKNRTLSARLYRRLFSTKLPRGDEDEESRESRPPTETSPLLNGRPEDSDVDSGDDNLDQQWEDAVASGRLRTTWQRETKTVISYSLPLIVTFFLQYSINVASIFAVGRIGKIELGAVSCK